MKKYGQKIACWDEDLRMRFRSAVDKFLSKSDFAFFFKVSRSQTSQIYNGCSPLPEKFRKITDDVLSGRIDFSEYERVMMHRKLKNRMVIHPKLPGVCKVLSEGRTWVVVRDADGDDLFLRKDKDLKLEKSEFGSVTMGMRLGSGKQSENVVQRSDDDQDTGVL